jgi:uncharacterized protein (DUF58 family)
MSVDVPSDAAPASLRQRADQIVTIVFHTVGLFVLPVLVGAGAVVASAAREVAQSSTRAIGIVTGIVAPLVVLQLCGVFVRGRRLWRHRTAARDGLVGVGDALDVLANTVVVLTRRGGWVFVTGLAFLWLALATGFADLAVFAVVLLLACVVVVAVGSIVGSVGVRIVDETTARRSVTPAVAVAGDLLQDTFVIDGVVPRGFGLRLVGPLPPRLRGETRLFLTGDPRRPRTRAQVALPSSPRGVHRLPAASVVVEDLLGLTAIVVGATAAASCKVLPAPRPIRGAEALWSSPTNPQAELAPRPRPREDLLALRTWVPGDDARRIHWRQSVRAGEWIVRTPEHDPLPAHAIHVVLDTSVAPGLAQTEEDRAGLAVVLDVAVDAWLGIVRAFLQQGHAVTLIAAVPDDAGQVALQSLACRTSRESAWRDLGARAVLQTQVPLSEVIAGHSDVIVVTAGLGGRGSVDAAEKGMPGIRVLVDAAALVPGALPDVAPWSWRRLFFVAHPAGSEDNRPERVAFRRRRDKARRADRAALCARLRTLPSSPGPRDLWVVPRGATLALVKMSTPSPTPLSDRSTGAAPPPPPATTMNMTTTAAWQRTA